MSVFLCAYVRISINAHTLTAQNVGKDTGSKQPTGLGLVFMGLALSGEVLRLAALLDEGGEVLPLPATAWHPAVR